MNTEQLLRQILEELRKIRELKEEKEKSSPPDYIMGGI